MTRTMKEWNGLPVRVIDSRDTESFKKAERGYFSKKLPEDATINFKPLFGFIILINVSISLFISFFAHPQRWVLPPCLVDY